MPGRLLLEAHSTDIDVRIAARLTPFENKIRVWKYATMILAVSIGVIICGGSVALPEVLDLFNARKAFQVVDEKGTVRILLGTTQDGRYGLHFFDATGKNMMAFEMAGANPESGIVIKRPDGAYTFLGNNRDGESSLQFIKNGVSIALLHGKDETTGITISDERGRRRIGLGNSAKDKDRQQYGLTVSDLTGDANVQLATFGNGDPTLQFRANGPNRILGLGLIGGAAAIVVTGADNTVRASIAYTDDELIKIDARSIVKPSVNITK